MKNKIEGPSNKPRVGRFKKSKDPLREGRYIEKKMNNVKKNKPVNTSTIIKEGDNYLAFNISNGPTIMGGGDVDIYTSSLNTYKANSHLTA